MRPLFRSAVRLGIALAVVAGPALAKSTSCLAAVSGPAGVVEAGFDQSSFLDLPAARTIAWSPPIFAGEATSFRMTFAMHDDGSVGLFDRATGDFDRIVFSDGEVVERAGGDASQSAFLARVSAELAERPHEKQLLVVEAGRISMLNLDVVALRDVQARAAKAQVDRALADGGGAVCREQGPYQTLVAGY